LLGSFGETPYLEPKMKATALLETQHRKVEAIFEKLEGSPRDPSRLLEELANHLAAHMAIEQEIFYPALREVDEDMVLESFEEHALAEIALKRLLGTEPDDASFQARVIATKELIEHHVKEEEDDLFPKVEKVLGERKLAELGARMKARFEEVLSQGFAATVPKGFAKTSSDVAKAAAA
jgi:iron-sulfur cluster repair protein YtfE (RIC family)